MGRGSATFAAIGAYLVLTAGFLPLAAEPGPELTGLIPFFVAGVLVAELATSFLLFSAFTESRAWPLLLLGCGYLYSGLMSVAHLLTFPGAVLAAHSVIGTAQSLNRRPGSSSPGYWVTRSRAPWLLLLRRVIPRPGRPQARSGRPSFGDVLAPPGR